MAPKGKKNQKLRTAKGEDGVDPQEELRAILEYAQNQPGQAAVPPITSENLNVLTHQKIEPLATGVENIKPEDFSETMPPSEVEEVTIEEMDAAFKELKTFLTESDSAADEVLAIEPSEPADSLDEAALDRNTESIQALQADAREQAEEVIGHLSEAKKPEEKKFELPPIPIANEPETRTAEPTKPATVNIASETAKPAQTAESRDKKNNILKVGDQVKLNGGHEGIITEIDERGDIRVRYTAKDKQTGEETENEFLFDPKWALKTSGQTEERPADQSEVKNFEKPPATAPENLPTGRLPGITLREWENNRRDQLEKLRKKYGNEEGATSKKNVNIIEQKIEQWERDNPRPLEDETKRLEEILKNLEAAAASEAEITGQDSWTEGAPLETSKPSGKKSGIKQVYNEAKLRQRIQKSIGGVIKKDEIVAEAKRQVEFVKVENVKSAIENLWIKSGFLSNVEAQARAELLSSLLREPGAEIIGLNFDLAAKTGLSIDTISELIRNARENILARAAAEVNQELTAGWGGKLLRISESGKTKITKIASYVGLGFLAAGTGGVGAASIVGLRVIDRYLTDKIKKGAVEKKAQEIRERINSDPAEQEVILNAFYTDLAASKQRQIHQVESFDWHDFLSQNSDLVEGYDKFEENEVTHALQAIEEINKINNQREAGLARKITKNKFTAGFFGFLDKWLVKGGETSSEKIVSTAAFGAAAYAARELPVIKNILSGLAGWKAGEFLANKIISEKQTEKEEIGDEATAEEILDILWTAQKPEKRKKLISGQDKKIIIKVAAAAAGALLPEVINSLFERPKMVAGGGKTEAEAAVTSRTETPIELKAVEPLAEPILKPAAEPAVIMPESAATISENPVTKAIEEMRNIHGKGSRHLWGLIEKKVGIMANDLKNVKGLEGFSKSTGRLDNVIDTIKREIAHDPAKYGFHPGVNIDVITAADLEAVSQNEAFNKLIEDAFRPGSLVEHAQNLAPETVKQIEENRDYFASAASQMPKGIRLGQHDYDLMAQYHGRGIAPEEAARLIGEEHLRPALAAGQLESAGAVIGTEAVPLAVLEKIHDAVTRDYWSNVFKGVDEQNKNLISKSLDAIFRRNGLANKYDALNLPYFKVENVSISGGKLGFEVPAPKAFSENIGNLKFSYDPATKELLAYAGDVSENIKNVENIDTALQSVFQKISTKI